MIQNYKNLYQFFFQFPVAAEAAHFSTDSNHPRRGRSNRAVKWFASNICRWRLVAKGAPSKAHTYCEASMALAEAATSSSKCKRYVILIIG